MPITEAQRLKRMTRLGSSDTPAILGCDPWKSAADVYFSKVSTEEIEEDKTSPQAELGNLVEGAMVDYVAGKLQIPFIKNQYRVHENKIHAANLDALGKNDPVLLEIKTTGLRGRIPEEEVGQWGPDGSAEIPFRVVAQVQHQFLCAGEEYQLAYVGAWVGFRGIMIYEVPRHDELIEIIRNKGEFFWREHVDKKIPPTDEPPKLDFLKNMIREKGKVVAWDSEGFEKMVMDWEDAVEFARIQNKIAAAAKDRKDYWDAKVMYAMGDAECAEIGDKEIWVKRTKRKGYVVEPTEIVQLKSKYKEKEDAVKE